MRRRSRLVLVWMVLCLVPRIGLAEDAPKPADDPARAQYDAYLEAASDGDLDGARASLGRLRALVAGTPKDDAERKQWCEALYRAQGTAQRYLANDTALIAGLFDDLTRLVNEADDAAEQFVHGHVAWFVRRGRANLSHPLLCSSRGSGTSPSAGSRASKPYGSILGLSS